MSNYPGWPPMKAPGIADRNGWPRRMAHQAYYSLIGRASLADLMPPSADRGFDAMVRDPLG